MAIASRYSDATIDAVLRHVVAVATYTYDRSLPRGKVAKVRAEMIRLRDTAGPRMGALPSPADLELALILRAKDLFGLSPETCFYLEPRVRARG